MVSRVNDSLYADALAPFLAETARAAPAGRRSDRRPHAPRARRGRALADARAAARPARRGRGAPRLRVPAARSRAPPLLPPAQRPRARPGPAKATAGWSRSAAWTRPKTRSTRPNAASQRARAGSSCTRARRTSCSTGRRWTSVFALAEEAARADPDPRRARAAAARRRARRPRAAPPRRGADPRARRDLRPGDPHDSRLADHPGVLYDISCFFPLDVIELFARVPAERIVFASDPPYGMPATTLYLALRVARQAGLDEPTTQAVLGGTMAALLDGHELPAADAAAPRRDRSRCRAGSRACTATRASSARRCSPARASRPTRCSTWRSPPAAIPQPGDDGEALETIGAALGAAKSLVGRAGRRAPGDRPRVPRDRARGDRDPRRARPPRGARSPIRRLGAVTDEPHGSPLAVAARAARACRALARTRATSSTCARSSPPAIRCAGAWPSVLGAARAAAGAAGSRAPRATLRRIGVAEPRQRLGAQVEAAQLDARSPLTAAFYARGIDALAIVVERQHRREAEPAAAIASTPEPVPTSSSGPRAPARRRPARAAARRHSRVVAWAPVPNAWPGSITISCDGPRARRAAAAPTAGARAAPAARARRAARRGGSISTGRWNCFQRSCQSSAVSLVEISTSASPAAALRSGRAGSSPGAP